MAGFAVAAAAVVGAAAAVGAVVGAAAGAVVGFAAGAGVGAGGAAVGGGGAEVAAGAAAAGPHPLNSVAPAPNAPQVTRKPRRVQRRTTCVGDASAAFGTANPPPIWC